MEEKEKKTEKASADALMEYLIASTYSRHSNLSEEEFLKEIGYQDSGFSEDKAIKASLFNLMVETTKELIRAKGEVVMLNGTLRLLFADDFKEKVSELN